MSESSDLIEYRIANLEGAVSEIKLAVKSIDASLQVLARLEVHHAETRDSLSRVFADIEDKDRRLRVLEAEAPTTRLIQRWVVGGVIGVVSLVGIATITLPSLPQ